MNDFLSHAQFNQLLGALREDGYTCIGPQVREESIVFEELNDAEQLPWGIQDVQAPGSYRLKQTGRQEAFAFTHGAQGIKPLLFKPRESLWRVERDDAGKLSFKSVEPQVKPLALIGMRACDLAGMAVQDKTFIQDTYQDRRYRLQREQLFIVAVNCAYSSANCFCVSTKTGPKASDSFDLALTEVDNGFVVEAGSPAGETILKKLNLSKAASDVVQQAVDHTERAIDMQTKVMPKNNSRELRDVLMNNLEHPRWEEVAERCLSCGNCTSVCPTCFCHHETETPAIDSAGSEHAREWDSCFSKGHSYIHSKVIRDDTKSQYKQWLTHKLGSWWDQFDTSGCIGCGRCVTWCPVGIDITEEMAAISGDTNKKG
jgi:ferredoxin